MSYIESKKIVIPNIGALSMVEGILARRYKHLIQADSKPRKNDTSKKKRSGQEQAAQF